MILRFRCQELILERINWVFRQGVKMVERNIEEALNLTGMQIHRQHARRTRFGDEIADQLTAVLWDWFYCSSASSASPSSSRSCSQKPSVTNGDS